DGRMFPITDNSETIINCLLREAEKHKIDIRTSCGIEDLQLENDEWILTTSKGEKSAFSAVFLATGSAHGMWDSLTKMGHKIVPPVPSLFTFNIKDERIKNLMGISVKHATVSVVGQKLQAKGALLITHWGMSGPAVLRLSAWGARALNEIGYKFSVQVNWCGEKSFAEVLELLKQQKTKHPKKVIFNDTLFEIPSRLWQSLVDFSGINAQDIWTDCSNKLLENLANELSRGMYAVSGKSTNKDEFVTAGGVDLREVDFRTMQSKVAPNLYFGGEVLNIDALTGGFNFQAAWTTAYIASENV
ncbi:MAG TPA: aminoacetone oxidase family FAD-binding enzyme, partial [Chitinophagales bacterium]